MILFMKEDMKRMSRLMILCISICLSAPCHAQPIGVETYPENNTTESNTEEGDVAELKDVAEENNSGSNQDKKKGKSKKQDKDKDKGKSSDKLKEQNEIIEELTEEIAAKDARILSMQAEIDSLQRDLAELLPFRIEKLNNLCKTVDVLETQPLSTIPQEEIDALRKRIGPFLSSSPELKEKDKRLNRLAERKGMFDSFKTSLATIPYGDELKKGYSKLKSEFSSGVSPAQQEEIVDMDKVMDAYPSLIPEFGKVIEEIQIQLEYARNNNDLSEAKDMARATVRMNDDFKMAKAKMGKVPYMDSLLGEYLELLSGNNPLDERIIEIEATVATMSESLRKGSNN